MVKVLLPKRVRILMGTTSFYFLIFFFLFPFFFLFSELAIAKVMYCFFFAFEVIQIKKNISNRAYKDMAYRNIALRVSSRYKVQIPCWAVYIQILYTFRFWHLDKPGNLLLIFNVCHKNFIFSNNTVSSLATMMAPAKKGFFSLRRFETLLDEIFNLLSLKLFIAAMV